MALQFVQQLAHTAAHALKATLEDHDDGTFPVSEDDREILEIARRDFDVAQTTAETHGLLDDPEVKQNLKIAQANIQRVEQLLYS